MTAQTLLKPTASTERISSMDIIRGVSLLGILLMNITGMGLFKAYGDPTNSGGATGLNLTVWWITNLFFEGTMRGMFSMLFGAGILLFIGGKSKYTEGSLVTDLYFRRLLWMLLFGVIHCYLLLWSGEILYAYSIVGMFAFSFRHLNPKRLIIAATVLFVIAATLNVKDDYQLHKTAATATAAKIKKSNGQTLTKLETKAIEKWDEKVKEDKPTPQRVQEEIKERTKGYFSIVMYRAPLNQVIESFYLYRYDIWDILAMMLLGMAFLKNGILKAAKSNRYYLTMALIGYAIGITTNYFETSYIQAHHFDILAFSRTSLTYDIGRVATTCGHIALIMLFVKSGWLPFLQKSLAAVGQMAFTNYIMHTIITDVIFLGFGFALFGKFQRYELYYIVFAIWIFQLIISPIWLKYFRFGPLEWLWRSLTYWKMQPMRRTTTSSGVAAPNVEAHAVLH